MTDRETPGSAAAIEEPWWKSTWCMGRTEWIRAVVALVAVVIVTVLVGETLTNWAAPNALVDLDVEVAENLAENRTDRNNDLAHWGALLADTPVKIGLSVLLAAGALWRWRRWYEATVIGLSLIFEASAYLASSLIIGRPRPDVERLLESPVATSFPSGHVAAATVYAVVAIIVFQRTRAVVPRAVAVVAVTAIPLIVAWARMYQGMHFLSDVIAGIVLGIVSIVICLSILGPPASHTQRTEGPTS